MADSHKLTKRHILFDMDGTLVDSQFAILDSLREALRENCVREPECLSTDLIGPPIAEIVRKADPSVSDDVLKDIVASFRRLYDSTPERGLTPYDGIAELLNTLLQRGFFLYVVTNKPIKPTRRILEYLGWKMFIDVVTPDSGPSPSVKRSKAESIAALINEHGLDAREVIMVGDTIGDVTAAHRAGVDAIAVLWGYEKNAGMLIEQAEYAAHTVQELESLFSQPE